MWTLPNPPLTTMRPKARKVREAMSACEECWTEAQHRALTLGGSVADHYRDALYEHGTRLNRVEILVTLVSEQRASVIVEAPANADDEALTELALQVLDSTGGAEWESWGGYVAERQLLTEVPENCPNPAPIASH